MAKATRQHPNAVLTPAGRARMVRCVLDLRWTIEATAERFQVDAKTVRKWRDRFLAQGSAGLQDRTSKPRSCPWATSPAKRAQVLDLRARRRFGAADIAHQLVLPPPPCRPSWPPRVSGGWIAVTGPAHPSAATSESAQASWSTSTSRSWRPSPRAVAGACTDAVEIAPTATAGLATASSTAPSTTAPASPTPRSSTTSRHSPRPPFGHGPPPSTPTRASRSSGSSRTTGPATAQATGTELARRPARW
jgi:transposase-like protein